MREMSLSFLDDGLARDSEMMTWSPQVSGQNSAVRFHIHTPFTSLFDADPKSKPEIKIDEDLMRMKSFIETGRQHNAYEKQMRGSPVG